MAGYIKLHRGWRDTDGLLPSKDFSDFEAWLWILENAAWKDGHRFNAKGEMVPIGRGQMHVSIRSLQTVFGWSKTRVERFLGRLKTVAKVTLEAGQSGTILTVCNYEKYQGDTDSDKPSRGTVASPVAGQSRDTHKEGKEGKEEKNNRAYAFSGAVIRLNDGDFGKWEKAFSGIDLRAALQSRDDWLAGQDDATRKRWFQSTSAWLAGKQQKEAKAEREASEPSFTGVC